MIQEEIKDNFEDFRESVLKIHGPKHHKISNSMTTYDHYKWIRKNKWLNIGRPLKESEFYSIIRRVNQYLAQDLLDCKYVSLPCKMGKLELRMYYLKVKVENGKLKTSIPINWDKTLKLWYEDEESRDHKTLVRVDNRAIYKVYYNKSSSNFKNKMYYKFHTNRALARKMSNEIKDGKIDAYIINS